MIVRIERAVLTVADGNLAGNFHRQVGNIETLNASRTGLALKDTSPDVIDTRTQRSDSTDAGYDNTSKFHIYAFKLAMR